MCIRDRASGSHVLRRTTERGLRSVRDLVRFGDSVYATTATAIHVHDVASLRRRRVLPLRGSASALAVSSSALFVLRSSLVDGGGDGDASGASDSSSESSSLQVLERHAPRSGWLLRGVASARASVLAPVEGGLVALDQKHHSLVHIDLDWAAASAAFSSTLAPGWPSANGSAGKPASAGLAGGLARGERNGVRTVWRCAALCAERGTTVIGLAVD
eukprot:7380992-Prymnesium_polylepis.1